MGARREAIYIRWLLRISDDMWGAAQLLGLFFLGATILCVPPRLGGPPDVTPYTATLPQAANPLSAVGPSVPSRPAAPAALASVAPASSFGSPPAFNAAGPTSAPAYVPAYPAGLGSTGLELIPYSDSGTAPRLIDTSLSGQSKPR
jgi:hypothetical protein